MPSAGASGKLASSLRTVGRSWFLSKMVCGKLFEGCAKRHTFTYGGVIDRSIWGFSLKNQYGLAVGPYVPCESIWSPYGPMGPVLAVWAPYGPTWGYMGLIWTHTGSRWAHMESISDPYGSYGHHMGSIWVHMEPIWDPYAPHMHSIWDPYVGASGNLASSLRTVRRSWFLSKTVCGRGVLRGILSLKVG